MKNIFPDYALVPAAGYNIARLKWNAVRDIRTEAPYEFRPEQNWDSLATFNQSVNQLIKYTPDQIDDWKSPIQTFQEKAGDCEDYAILKRAILLDNGFKNNQIAMVVGDIAMSGRRTHAFLVVEIDDHQMVLDSMFTHLIEPKDYINFTPTMVFIGDDVYFYSKLFTLANN